MCLIIDACVIGKVFSRNNAEHKRFEPVQSWVTSGTGSVIYGGTKYLKELSNGKYLAIFVELAKAGRAVRMDTKAVDDRALVVKSMVPEADFDDEHIVALVGISRCRLVCTDDVRSIPYLKRKELYPSGVKAPHIYRKLADKRHCCGKMIVEICPARPVPSKQRGKKPKSRPTVDINTVIQA